MNLVLTLLRTPKYGMSAHAAARTLSHPTDSGEVAFSASLAHRSRSMLEPRRGDGSAFGDGIAVAAQYLWCLPHARRRR